MCVVVGFCVRLFGAIVYLQTERFGNEADGYECRTTADTWRLIECDGFAVDARDFTIDC